MFVYIFIYNLLQYSCLGNPTDGEVWRAIILWDRKVRDDLETKQQKQMYAHICIHMY